MGAVQQPSWRERQFSRGLTSGSRFPLAKTPRSPRNFWGVEVFSRQENRSTNDRFSYLFILFNFALFAVLREFFSYSLESS